MNEDIIHTLIMTEQMNDLSLSPLHPTEHLQLEFQRQKEMRERLEKQLVEDEKVKCK